MAKRKQQSDPWGMDREYPSRGYKQTEARLSLDEQLQQVQARIENIRNGSDDALLEESELLSRTRDEKLNALAVKDGSSGTKAKGTNRSSCDAARKVISDEFDQLRSDAQKRLLKEAMDEEERIKEEIASNKSNGVQMREKRKTRARLDTEAAVPNSQNNILNKLVELEGKVGLNREDLDRDLDCLRSKDGKPTKPVPVVPVVPVKAIGKTPSNSKPQASVLTGTGKGAGTSRGQTGGARAFRRDDSVPCVVSEKQTPSVKSQTPPPTKQGNGRMPGEHKVYSAKGIMYCSGLRILKGEEVRVTMPDGEIVVGKLSSVNSLEMRLVIDGQENLFKVMLAHLRTGKASVVKMETQAPSA